MVETGDKVLVFTDGTGKYWLEESSTPEVGDKGLIVSKDNVNFFLSGTTPEIGDKCGVFEIDNKIFIQPLGGGILQYFDARLHYYIVDYYQWLYYASVTTKCLDVYQLNMKMERMMDYQIMMVGIARDSGMDIGGMLVGWDGSIFHLFGMVVLHLRQYQ